MIVSWISVLACIALCVDILRRTNWATHPQFGKRRLTLGSGAILIVFLSFGVFLSMHKKALSGEGSQTAKAQVGEPGKLPEPKRESPAAPTETKKQPPNRPLAPKGAKSSVPNKGISVGTDSVAMGHIPDGSKIGDGSVVIGPTDANGNTILNQGGLAVGNGASAGPTSIAIGAHANAGVRGVGPVTVQPGAVASFGQQGGITAGQVNLFGPDQIPVTLTYSQIGNTVTVTPSGRIDSTSLAFFFDVDVSLSSHSLGTCMSCGNGRLNDSNGLPDNKTIWIFWASPAFTPDDPLSVTVSSITPAKVLRVARGPRPPR
jgi:hypothetical protein